MRKFNGNINGVDYTDENEFNKALFELDGTNDMTVSYQYVSVPDVKNEECNSEKIVLENEYVKNISNRNEIKLDSNLINKLKNATNKTDINKIVNDKIVKFDNKIEDNLLHINDLKSDYKKLDEKIKLINSQIKTLDEANNNYYLQKEYYTNIKSLIESSDNTPEIKSDSCCGCNCGCEGCNVCDYDNMSPQELVKYFKENNVPNLAKLIEYFIKK